MFRIDMIPARQGDCLWIEYGSASSPNRVLIDGGVTATYDILRDRILALPRGRRIFELVVVTHVDRDHIEGLIKLLNDTSLGLEIQEIWYNGWRHLCQPDELGALQGEFMSALINKRKIPWNTRFQHKAVVIGDQIPVKKLDGGLELTLLSPTVASLTSMRSLWHSEVKNKNIDPGDAEAALEHMYEHRSELVPDDLLGAEDDMNLDRLAMSLFKHDKSRANASSIALLAKYKKRSCLLAGDAHPSILEKSVRKMGGRLLVDAFKLAHHGGKGNLSTDLLKVVRTRRYLISTDGSYFKHPHAETIARIVHHGGERPIICFNYPRSTHKRWDNPGLKARYSFDTDFSGSVDLE